MPSPERARLGAPVPVAAQMLAAAPAWRARLPWTPESLILAQVARYGRRLTRPRYQAMRLIIRRAYSAASYRRRVHVSGPMAHDLLLPLKSERALCLGLAARALAWAGRERRAGYLEEARRSLEHAKWERQAANAPRCPLSPVAPRARHKTNACLCRNFVHLMTLSKCGLNRS